MGTTIQYDTRSFPTAAPSDELKAGLSGAGVTKRSNSISDVAKNNTFISHAAQQEAGSKTNMAAGPVLRAPFAHITAYDSAEFESALCAIRDDPQLENRIARTLVHPSFIEAADTLRTQTTAVAGVVPQSDDADFDIMTINTKSADLLIRFLLLMLQSRATEARFNGAMTIKNAEAVARSADAIRSEGTTQTATGVTAGVTGIVFSLAGAGSKWIAGGKSRSNDKYVARPMEARQAETAKLNSSLNSAKSAKTDDELKTLEVNVADGSNKTQQVAPSGAGLSAADHAKITSQINANQAMDQADVLANAANQKTIAKWNLGGDVLTAIGGSSAVIGSSGHLSAALDRAVQKTSDLDSRVAAQSADDGRDKGKGLIELIRQLLDSMMAINQSRNATVGAVAANIKA